MKVANAEKHVLGHSGLAETKTFEIRASAHAFKILSSGLYSDKVAAVLREIGCNAYDAHVEAGCTQKPFEVKLPNKLDPQFYIRDHGPGLSHDGVMNLYTTYFASTKQESNDFTGAFGLGSKSPFSYTDAFTVTSCHGGKKRIYTAHIGDKGSPVVALMGEGPLDPGWEHGLEIGFPVRPNDFQEFATKAATIYRGFKTLPKILGGVPIRPLNTTEDFGEYAFLENEHGILVLMGNVFYPLDASKLRVPAGKKENAFLTAARGMNGVLLRFNIGELQVAASREELQYDPNTQDALESRLIKAVSDVMKELKKKYSDVKTWSEMCAASKMKETVSQGLYITSELLEAAGVSKKAAAVYNSRYFQIPPTDATKGFYCIMEHDGVKIKVNRPSSATGKDYIEFGDNITIVSGVEKNAYARVKKALIENTLTGRVILVQPRDKTQASVQGLASDLENIFVGVPSLPLANFPPPPSMRVKRKKGQIPGFPSILVGIDGKSITVASVDPDRQIYLPIYTRSSWGRHSSLKYLIHPSGQELQDYEWNRLWNHVAVVKKEVKCFDLKAPVLVRRGDAKRCRFDLRPDWKPFDEHARDELLKKANLDALAEEVEGHKPIVDLRHESNPNSVVESLITMKQFQPAIFKKVEPILRENDLLDEVEVIHKRSWGARDRFYQSHVEPPVLSSYKEIARTLDVKVDTPAFKAATLSLDGKFKDVGIDYKTMVSVGKVSSEALTNLLEEMIL